MIWYKLYHALSLWLYCEKTMLRTLTPESAKLV